MKIGAPTVVRCDGSAIPRPL